MKFEQDNDVANRIGAVYIENDTEFLWLIGLSADCDENQIGQRHDWSYKCNLCQKWNWDVIIDWTR